MPVTERLLRRATWDKNFEHRGFKVFTSPDVPGLVLIHREGRVYYRVDGKETDSTFEAVRLLNAGINKPGRRTG